MAPDATSWGTLIGSGFKAYNQYEAGKEAEAVYKSEAVEVANQTAYEQRMALEEMKELDRQGRSQASAAIAAGGKSGLAVGGSIVTLSQSISAKVDRKKAMTALEFNERARRGAFEMEKLRYKGRSYRLAGTTEAWGSLLTGGLKLAQRKEDLQKATGKQFNWGDVFFKTDKRM